MISNVSFTRFLLFTSFSPFHTRSANNVQNQLIPVSFTLCSLFRESHFSRVFIEYPLGTVLLERRRSFSTVSSPADLF